MSLPSRPNESFNDNYNFFVIGYASTERASDAILSIAVAANGVGLAFLHGASLPGPKKLLLAAASKTVSSACRRLSRCGLPTC